MQRTIADLLANRVKDPAIAEAFLSITRVDVAADLSNARVHISVLPTEGSDPDEVFEALARSEPFLHRELARELHIRRIPRLRFERDRSMEEGERITSMMRDVAQSEGREF